MILGSTDNQDLLEANEQSLPRKLSIIVNAQAGPYNQRSAATSAQISQTLITILVMLIPLRAIAEEKKLLSAVLGKVKDPKKKVEVTGLKACDHTQQSCYRKHTIAAANGYVGCTILGWSFACTGQSHRSQLSTAQQQISQAGRFSHSSSCT